MFNDYWMLDQGLLDRERKGDLRDLITRRHADRATVTAAPDISMPQSARTGEKSRIICLALQTT